MLIGFGAAAVNPYLAFESIEDLIREGELTGIEAGDGGAQLPQGARQGRDEGDEQDGHLHRRLLHRRAGVRGHRARPATSSTSTSPAPSANSAASASTCWPRRSSCGTAAPTRRTRPSACTAGSRWVASTQFRREGELHLFTPETVFLLQHSTRTGRHEVFAKYSDEVNRLSREGGTLRGLFEFKTGPAAAGTAARRWSPSTPSVTRFNTGAMSYGSISAEAHETMAIAMNNLGGRSNTRRGRRGRRPALRPAPAQRGQAGRVRPVRGHQRLPGQRHRHPDQDGSGRQTRRGRPASGLQGVSEHRQDPALHARRRPDLAAAAPRHLLDRGSRAADPRPEERQLRRPASTSSWSARSASARSRPGCPRRTPTSCSSRATTAAPVRRR